jgi:hypothetical protein
MAYALMALMAARDLYRHIAKMAGWEPRYRPIRNHVFNAVFASSALLIAAGGLAQWKALSTAGWFVCGAALISGTTVPCGWSWMNNSRVLWPLRQLFFLSLGIGVLAFALGVL